MEDRMKNSAAILLIALVAGASPARAQDIRGLERCMAEKQIERRTGCLQANDEFLQQELTKAKRAFEDKLAANGREIAAAKADIAALKASLEKLEAELKLLKSKPAPAAKP
jgi:phage shock protein A